MSAYGYVRVSSAEQVQGTSLEEQTRKVEGVAMIRGEAIVEVFTDGAVSGSIPLGERPQGSALLAKLQPGDVVIAAKMDRLFRSASDALATAEELKRQGVDLILADMGTDPVTGNGVSKMFFGMLALMAEFERSRILERIADGKRVKGARGGYTGGKRQFGYQIVGQGKDAVLVEDEQEQAAIRRILALKAEGKGLRAIAAAIQADGIALSHVGVRSVIDRHGES